MNFLPFKTSLSRPLSIVIIVPAVGISIFGILFFVSNALLAFGDYLYLVKLSLFALVPSLAVIYLSAKFITSKNKSRISVIFIFFLVLWIIVSQTYSNVCSHPQYLKFLQPIFISLLSNPHVSVFCALPL